MTSPCRQPRATHFRWLNSRHASVLLCGMMTIGAILILPATTLAQRYDDLPGTYHPLDQGLPLGVAGRWAGYMPPQPPNASQVVQFVMPSTASVSVFSSRMPSPVTQAAPALVGVAVGHVYRVRIADIPEFPGRELFPTIEVLDCLHPPAGTAQNYPVPAEITLEELELALGGKMITKVIYLEQPQLAEVANPEGDPLIRTLPPFRNAIAEADRYGRPMLILRIGGRTPNANGDNHAFFAGSGGPIWNINESAAVEQPENSARLESRASRDRIARNSSNDRATSGNANSLEQAASEPPGAVLRMSAEFGR